MFSKLVLHNCGHRLIAIKRDGERAYRFKGVSFMSREVNACPYCGMSLKMADMTTEEHNVATAN